MQGSDQTAYYHYQQSGKMIKTRLVISLYVVILMHSTLQYCKILAENLLKINKPRHEIFNNVVCATSKGSDQPAHTRSLIRGFASLLNIL